MMSPAQTTTNDGVSDSCPLRRGIPIVQPYRRVRTVTFEGSLLHTTEITVARWESLPLRNSEFAEKP